MSIRRMLALMSATLVVVVSGSAPAPAAASTGWVRCLFAGTATMSPGLTMRTADVVFQSTFRLTGCTSSDPGITGGTARSEGTLSGNCLAAQGTGTQWITWSNGRESVATGSFLNLGAEVVTESVSSGEFAGTPGWNVNVVTGPATAPLSCGLGGLTSVSFAGYISFG